ncbi:hypothetical protein OGAPHI_000292 [Ogataea philodendri]|uniref:Uncharacterized protein n=1 Tax=Ogataea philodendri TaxID=1378263 RepID=A0A9P8PHP4_9ASCO|nr:uncharacterized protein OGAPHI_000292 [Ogataea philodendri]KAH3671589.1 hypothetical protein OGAPHI_000292 [Ogataea philodendri]
MSIGTVGRQITHNRLNSDRFLRLVPGIIVRGHTDHLVGDLGFSSKFRFRDAGHVNHRSSPRLIQSRLCSSREGRSFHTNQGQVRFFGFSGVQLNVITFEHVLACVSDDFVEF